MRVRLDERLFDIKAILVQDERGFPAVLGQSRAYEIECCGRDIWDILRGEDHVVVRLDAFFDDVWDRVTDLGDSLAKCRGMEKS